MEERPTRASCRHSYARAPSTTRHMSPALPHTATVITGHMRWSHLAIIRDDHTHRRRRAPSAPRPSSLHRHGSACGPDDSDNPIAYCPFQHKALYANVDKQRIGRKGFTTDHGAETAHLPHICRTSWDVVTTRVASSEHGSSARRGIPPQHWARPHNAGCRDRIERVLAAWDAATPWGVARAWGIATSSEAVEDVPPTVSRHRGCAARRQPASSTLAPAAEPRATR